MPDDDHASRVIVVGSSAGGLDALKQLLGAAHPGLGWCFVIAQHLAPDDTSAVGTAILSIRPAIASMSPPRQPCVGSTPVAYRRSMI